MKTKLVRGVDEADVYVQTVFDGQVVQRVRRLSLYVWKDGDGRQLASYDEDSMILVWDNSVAR